VFVGVGLHDDGVALAWLLVSLGGTWPLEAVDVTTHRIAWVVLVPSAVRIARFSVSSDVGRNVIGSAIPKVYIAYLARVCWRPQGDGCKHGPYA